MKEEKENCVLSNSLGLKKDRDGAKGDKIRNDSFNQTPQTNTCGGEVGEVMGDGVLIFST